MRIITLFFLLISVTLGQSQKMTIFKSNGSTVVLSTSDIDSITFAAEPDTTSSGVTNYPLHENINASLFWVGEGASDANHGITNVGSAWRGDWGEQYGLEDWPSMSRDSDGFPLDARYKGTENPYYFALPYNDMGALISDESGNEVIDFNSTTTGDEWGRKKSSLTVAYWKDERSWPDYDLSMVKNRWVKISIGNTVCYAQWEDAGPFFYNDTAYVFGTARPINEQYQSGDYNLGAGIDFSPAVMHYLTGDATVGETVVSWQFIDEENVPDGPWKRVVTTSQLGGW